MHRFHQRNHALGDQFSGVRVMPSLQSAAHCSVRRLVRDQAQDSFREHFARGGLLLQHERSARFDIGAGIVKLMIVRRRF